MWRWRSSIFLRVLEISHGSRFFLRGLEVSCGFRHLLETIRGSSVHLTSSKVSFFPFSRELFSHVALLLLGTWDGPITFLSYPIAPWAFLQVYMLGPIYSPWPNCFLGLRPGWGLLHSPTMLIDFNVVLNILIC